MDNRGHAFDRVLSRLLLGLGFGLLSMGLSKPVLMMIGTRVSGHIVSQEGGISTRGATRVRYAFYSKDGSRHTGTAYTAAKHVHFTRVSITYLPFMPAVNMPAYAGYAMITALGWSLAGMGALAMGWSLASRSRRPRPPR